MWTTNLTSASKSSTFGRVNRAIGSTALRSLFLTKSRKETSLVWIINLNSVTAVGQCAKKYKITHSPLRSITVFHCFADMYTIRRQKHNKGKSVQVSGEGVGVLHNKRLLRMCCCNGVTFLVELLEWGRTFSGLFW